MNEFERRLAACAPAADGLNADAMLFAAGRASVKLHPARFAWPLATVALLALTMAFAFLWKSEREERISLAGRLSQSPPSVIPTGSSRPEPAADEYSRPAGNLLEVHRALEQGRDPLLPEPEVFVGTSGQLPETDVLRPDSLNRMLNP